MQRNSRNLSVWSLSVSLCWGSSNFYSFPPPPLLCSFKHLRKFQICLRFPPCLVPWLMRCSLLSPCAPKEATTLFSSSKSSVELLWPPPSSSSSSPEIPSSSSSDKYHQQCPARCVRQPEHILWSSPKPLCSSESPHRLKGAPALHGSTHKQWPQQFWAHWQHYGTSGTLLAALALKSFHWKPQNCSL